MEQSVKTEGWYSNIFTLKISLPHDKILICNNRKTPLIFNVLSQTGQYETESKSLLIYRGQSQLPSLWIFIISKSIYRWIIKKIWNICYIFLVRNLQSMESDTLLMEKTFFTGLFGWFWLDAQLLIYLTWLEMHSCM